MVLKKSYLFHGKVVCLLSAMEPEVISDYKTYWETSTWHIENSRSKGKVQMAVHTMDEG